MTEEDIRRLETINRKLIDDIEDKTKLREHNLAFHMAIADISGNPLIKMMVQSLIELLNTLYPQSRQPSEYIRDTYRRHEAIIRALRERNAEQCQKTMAIDPEHTKKLVV
ncbi:MAG: FCD domain-containing protein [Deltaproteobacteria bacterium]|nr:MAG: FCD domain-containing protein [Deltaproteobacteria bacterium]